MYLVDVFLCVQDGNASSFVCAFDGDVRVLDE